MLLRLAVVVMTILTVCICACVHVWVSVGTAVKLCESDFFSVMVVCIGSVSAYVLILVFRKSVCGFQLCAMLCFYFQFTTAFVCTREHTLFCVDFFSCAIYVNCHSFKSSPTSLQLHG